MYQITDTLFVGNIYEAEKPPANISAVLLVAEEFTPDPPAGVIYERIPFKEFGEAKPASLNQAIELDRPPPSGQSGARVLPRRDGPFRVGRHGLSVLCAQHGLS